MKSYESSLLVDAPGDKVWGVVSNVAAWPRWLPTISRIDALDGPELGLGFRFVVHQPKLKPATWKITQLDPPRLFAWEARYPGLRVIAEHAVIAETPRSARVGLRMTFAGLFGAMAATRLRTVTEDYLAQEAAAFRRTAEGLP
jgi:uncharacterized membrane protein